MKILITGGCGFIGSHIVELYQAFPRQRRQAPRRRVDPAP
jgi:nucleoside-diphosphate-sugar epimerase